MKTHCATPGTRFFNRSPRSPEPATWPWPIAPTDNLETLLHQLFRGTGPSGLAGIPPHRPLGDDLVLVRPLLEVRRDLIRQALGSLGQAWREDSSNQDTRYRRNWIRRELIPLLETEYPQASASILRAIPEQREWRSVLESLAEEWLESHLVGRNPVRLRQEPSVNATVLRMAMVQLWKIEGWPRGEMTRSHWHRLAEFIAESKPSRLTLPGRIDARSDGQHVELRRP